MPGNHDEPRALAKAAPGAAIDENGFLQYAEDTPAGRCLFLNTRRKESDAGEYYPLRLAWLKNEMSNYSSGPLLIFMHHPPMKVGMKSMDTLKVQENEAFFAAVEPHVPRIRHLFFGHVHRPTFGNWRGISFSCMRGLNHQLALQLEAPENSLLGSFEPAAYGVVLADEDQVVIHMHEFMDRSPRFELAAPEGVDSLDYSLNMRHGDWDRMT